MTKNVRPDTTYQRIYKPLWEYPIAFILLLFSLPLQILIALLLFVLNQSRVLFIQRRPGKNEVIFKILKFRTMNDNRNANGILLPDSMRQLHFGNFLRRAHLDELPQLWNVIKGELSLIGPRPLLEEYLSRYNEAERLRHRVKPGITGLTQALGGNTLTWQQRFRLDVFYVKHQSFKLDMYILLRSLKYLMADDKQRKIFSDEYKPDHVYEDEKHLIYWFEELGGYDDIEEVAKKMEQNLNAKVSYKVDGLDCRIWCLNIDGEEILLINDDQYRGELRAETEGGKQKLKELIPELHKFLK